jgi:hypothetical protein
MRKAVLCCARIAAAFAAAGAFSGCVEYHIDGVFSQPVLGRYQRFVVYGLKPERQQALMASFMRAFSNNDIVFVEGEDLIYRRSALSKQMEAETRKKIQKQLSVDGIVLAEYSRERGRETQTEKLMLRVIDAETGEISGSAIVSARSESGVRIGVLAEKAVFALKADLGRRRGGFDTPAERSRKAGSRFGDY